MERGALWLVVSGQPKKKLRDVPEPFTCDITDEVHRPMGRCAWSIGCKPGDPSICVSREQGEVRLMVPAERPEDWEVARVRAAPAQGIRVEPVIRGSGDEAACPANAPPVVLDTKLEARRKPGEEGGTARFELPQLGVGLDALALIRPTACDSERVRNQLSFYCMSVESSWRFTATAKGGVLRLRTSSSSYDGDMASSLGAVKLPCGAEFKWPKLRIRDHAWSAVGIGQCGQACRERHADCDDRCRTQHPADYHDDGVPALDQGEDCLAECELKEKACPCGQFQ
jgi:hypothetical protein